jgi:hypothetical protein
MEHFLVTTFAGFELPRFRSDQTCAEVEKEPSPAVAAAATDPAMTIPGARGQSHV